MKEVKQIGGVSKGKAKKPELKERPARESKTVTVPFPWLYASIVLFLLPQAGVEPARVLLPTGF